MPRRFTSRGRYRPHPATSFPPAAVVVAPTGITVTEVLASASTTNAASYATGSYTFQNNLLYIAFVSNSFGTAIATPTIIGTTSLHAWVGIVAEPFGSAAVPVNRISAFRMLVTSGAASETLTIASADTSNSGCAWHVMEIAGTDVSGSDGSGAIVQSAVNLSDPNVTTLTVTMSTITTGNTFIGGFSQPAANVLSADTNFTAGTNQTYNSPGCCQNTEYNVAATGTAVKMNSTGSTKMGGIGIEVKVA